jgi:hypothetical protein
VLYGEDPVKVVIDIWDQGDEKIKMKRSHTHTHIATHPQQHSNLYNNKIQTVHTGSTVPVPAPVPHLFERDCWGRARCGRFRFLLDREGAGPGPTIRDPGAGPFWGARSGAPTAYVSSSASLLS